MRCSARMGSVRLAGDRHSVLSSVRPRSEAVNRMHERIACVNALHASAHRMHDRTACISALHAPTHRMHERSRSSAVAGPLVSGAPQPQSQLHMCEHCLAAKARAGCRHTLHLATIKQSAVATAHCASEGRHAACDGAHLHCMQIRAAMRATATRCSTQAPAQCMVSPRMHGDPAR
jgi:hypothetical protein